MVSIALILAVTALALSLVALGLTVIVCLGNRE